MDMRKSLGHALLEDAGSSISSPLRRRSIAPPRATPSAIEIPNDDSTERAGTRRSISITGLSRMTVPQVQEGIAECIKLNTQNKINIKNAFSLSMIDYMEFMVVNREEGIANLQVAGTTLDVAAKIYGLRVDSLHQDTLKMVGHLENQSKDANEQENNDTNSIETENRPPEKRKKKKKSSQKILNSMEALQSKNEKISLEPPMFGDADCQTTDMLYQVMLPNHCKKDRNLPSFNDVILDMDNLSKDTDNRNEVDITWPETQMDLSVPIGTSFVHFSSLNWNPDDTESNPSSQELQDSVANDSMAFDMNASLSAAENNAYNAPNFFDIDDEHDESQVDLFQEMNRVPEKIVDVREIDDAIDYVLNNPLGVHEYSYFNDTIDIRQSGPTQWNVRNPINRLPTGRVVGACRQDAIRKKKDFRITFSAESSSLLDDKYRIPKANIHRVAKKTARYGWLKEKLLLGPHEKSNGHFDVIEYNLRPGQFIHLTKQARDKNTTENGRVENNELTNELMEHDNDNNNEIINNDNIDHDDHFMDEDIENGEQEVFTQGVFFDNLVDAPKLTEKIYIPFSQRAKKLDMRNLKRTIWKSLEVRDDGEKENIGNDNMAIDPVKDIKKFSRIFEHLPEQLNNNDAAELSFPLAFVSLLHLANEKCLRVMSTDNCSDLSIFQEEN